MKLKTKILAAALAAMCLSINAQAPYWKLNGNPTIGPDAVTPANNFLGTDATNATTLSIGTNGLQRVAVSHLAFGAPMQPVFGTPIPIRTNPLPGNRLTRVSISRDAALPVTAPLSLLHIGYDPPLGINYFPPNMFQLGFRTWQDVGAMFCTYDDHLYIGMREKDMTDPTGRTSIVRMNPDNDNDQVISWGDNYSKLPPGSSNNLAFIFHTAPSYVPQTERAATDYGLELMRMTGEGNVGIGPVFYDNATPQSILHINNEGTKQTYIQISNELSTLQTINDGFHIGIASTGEAELIQKEKLDMRFYTDNTQMAVIKSTGNVGINTNVPGNRTEITTSAINPYFGSVSGSSGLRFTNLTSAKTPMANPGQGVLSVDANGDVIYVPGGSGSGLGNLCGAASNPLAGDYEIPMNLNSFFFTGDNNLVEKVNIGYPCRTSTIAKLNASTVVNTNAAPVAGVSPNSAAIYGKSAYTGVSATNAGVMGEADDIELFSTVYGVWGRANTGTSEATGVRGTSESANLKYNYGGSFYAANSTLNNIGVNAIAKPSTGSPAPLTYAASYPGGANIGIYAAGDPSNSNTGTPFQDWAGWFDGDVNINGVGYISAGVWSVSDKRFKTNIKKLDGINSKLKKLNGYTYNFRTEEFKDRGFGKTEQIGVIAQELQEVFPQLVKEDAKGFLTVNYQGLVPVLLEAVKEQQTQNELQQQQIDELKALVQSLAGVGSNKMGGSANSMPVNLSDKNSIVLDQNVPNPFAESTVISYNIPDEFSKAQIIFSTNDGRVIKTIDITEKGAGTLNVFANDLSHGMYTYTLVIDGKTVASKKMIKE